MFLMSHIKSPGVKPLLFLLFISAFLRMPAQEPAEPARILLISSHHLTHTWSMKVSDAILQAMEQGPKKAVVDYLNLNALRNNMSHQEDIFRPYLNRIQAGRYDLVVALRDDAVELLLENLSRIPKNLPIIACGFRKSSDDFLRQHPNITFFFLDFHIQENIELGLKIFPDTRTVAVITDAYPSGLYSHNRALMLRSLFPQCRFIFINASRYSTNQMLETIGNLQEKSLVIFTAWRSYMKDGYLSQEMVARELAKRAKRPFLTPSEEMLDNGALGGYMFSGDLNGRRIAGLIKQILESKTPKPPAVIHDSGKTIIDMAVWNKANLKHSVHPANAEFRNKMPSIWEAYRTELTILLCAFGFIIVLLASLLVMYVRYQKVARRNMVIFNSLPLRVGVSDIHGNILFYHEDSSARRWINHSNLSLVRHVSDMTWIDTESTLEIFRQIFAEKIGRTFSTSFNDSHRMVVCELLPRRIFGKEALLWISQDVTELENSKRREEEAKSFLQTLLDDMPASVLAKDINDDFRIVLWNKEMERQTGVSADQAIGKTDFELDAFPGSAESFRKHDLELLEAGHTINFIEECTTASGKKITYNSFRTVMETESGKSFILDLSIDTTREHELEQERLKMIRELNNHIRNEQVINQCLQGITLQTSLEEAVNEMLGLIGQNNDADLCYICRYSDQRTRANAVYGWNNSGIRLEESLSNIDMTRYPKTQESFLQKQDVVISDLLHPPEFFENEAAFLLKFNIQSALLAGIWIDGQLWGFVGVNYIRRSHSFTDSDIHIIHDAANLFVIANERNRQMNAIADTVSLQKQIFDTVDLPIVMIDRDFNVVTANTSSAVFAKESIENIRNSKCHNHFCKYMAVPEWCPSRKTIEDRLPHQADFSMNGRELVLTSQPIFDRNNELISVLEIAMDVTAVRQQSRKIELNSLLLNRAAEVTQITYFKGDKDGNITLLGGNTNLGLPMDNRPHSLVGWLQNEDLKEFAKARDKLTESSENVVEIICRATVNNTRRIFRMRVTGNSHSDPFCIGILHDITDAVEAENVKNDLIKRLSSYVTNERILNTCLTQTVLEEDFDKNTVEILRIIAVRFNCERAFLGVFQTGSVFSEFTHEWSGQPSGTDSLNHTAQALKNFFTEHFMNFRNDRMLRLPEEEDSASAAALEGTSCACILCIPVWFANSLYGILGIGFSTPHPATEPDENIMRSISKIISLAKEHAVQRERLDATIRERQVIFNKVKVPIMFYDRNLRLIRINPAGCLMAGKNKEMLISHSCHEAFCFCGSECVSDRCIVRRVFATGKSQTSEITLLKREYIISAEPILDRTGEVANVVLNAVDITEINEHKRQLETAMIAAQAASRAKSYFLATMSHELRTPLNAVIGFSELLQLGNVPKNEQKEYLKSINLAGNALLNLINDVLDLSKIEAEQTKIIPVKTDFKALLLEIQAIFKHKLFEKNLEMRLYCPNSLPLLYLDNLRLRQILLNLTGNAIKFTHKGHVNIHVEFTPRDGQTGTLTVRVLDTGIGIPKEYQRKIFEPFFQQQDAVRGHTTYEGTGLGLAISQRLIAQMDGRLELVSTPGKGSVFTIVLKNVRFEKPEVPPERLLAEGCDSDAGEAPKARPLKVLLLDDVPMNLKVLSSMLKKLNAETFTANSGEEALHCLAGQKFDLILTDMWMPGMNGQEFAAEVRKRPVNRRTVLYAVTADTEATDNFNMKSFNGILHKPLVIEKLKTILDSIEPDSGS